MKRRSAGFRAPPTKVIRTRCWFLAGIYAVGRGTFRKTTLNAYKWAYIVSVGSQGRRIPQRQRASSMGVLDNQDDARGKSIWPRTAAGGWRVATPPGLISRPTSSLTFRPTVSHATASRSCRHRLLRKTVAGDHRPPVPPILISPPGPRSPSVKKDDIDAIMERVPSGLRKRFGF